MSSTPSRRALLKGASLATLAAAIPATIATAIGAPSAALAEAPDPIFNLFAKRDQLRVLARAADARMAAIERPLGPVVDFGRPEFAPMAKGNSYDQARDGKEITREEIEEYNARDEQWALRSDFHGTWEAMSKAAELTWKDTVAAGNVFIAAGERLRELQGQPGQPRPRPRKPRARARRGWRGGMPSTRGLNPPWMLTSCNAPRPMKQPRKARKFGRGLTTSPRKSRSARL